MATVSRFVELLVWQAARRLTQEVYTLSRTGEFARDYGLRDQMRRSSVSVMDNIAEGFESRTQAQFIEYLGRAKASCGELRSQCYVALDAGYLTEAQFQQLLAQAEGCSRQTRSFMSYLEARPNSQRIREDQATYTIDLNNPPIDPG
jgi:four helix bundle protein